MPAFTGGEAVVQKGRHENEKGHKKKRREGDGNPILWRPVGGKRY